MDGAMRHVAAWLVLWTVWAVPVLAESDLGDRETLTRIENALAAVAENVQPSVVAIRADRRVDDDERRQSRRSPSGESRRGSVERLIPAVGTGMIIREDGLVLTNEHVIHNADPRSIEVVLSNGDVYAVQEIISDPRSDLAVLRIHSTGLTPVKFGHVDEIRRGNFVLVLGNPYGTASDHRGQPSMTFGVVSALGRDLTHQLDPSRKRYYGNLIETDARINPGNSGGPLLNIRGEVVGVTTAISTRSGGSEAGYAVPIDARTREIIARLSEGREIEYGYLGVELNEPSASDRQAAGAPARRGALVIVVEPGSPAYRANLRPGDVIVEFEGGEIENVDELVRLVGAAPIGEKINMRVYRDGKQLTLGVVLGRRSDLLSGTNILTWRGMKLANATSDIRRSLGLPDSADGVVVTYIEEEGPAGKAGLAVGQILRRIGGVELTDVSQLREIASRTEGPVKIQVGGDPPVEITLP